jgi:serralysin
MPIVKTFDAILAGGQFPELYGDDELRWNHEHARGTQQILTYSFSGAPEAARIDADYEGFDNLSPFNAQERKMFGKALDNYARESGLVFAAKPSDGDIRGVAFSDSSTLAGIAAFPAETVDFVPVAVSRDMVESSDDTAKGSYWYMVVLHELGHALGLKHPHDGSTHLVEHWNNTNQTVMSYGDVFPIQPNLRRLDIDALQHLYGESTKVTAVWDEKAGVVRAKGTDKAEDIAGGNDPLSFRGMGGDDRAFGTTFDDRLGGGDGDDRLLGDDGDDILTGAAGDDALRGEKGDDLLRGLAGDDQLGGGVGADRLIGGAGDDALAGHDDGDALRGGAGADKLDGGEGEDDLGGGSGGDSLKGGRQDDLLRGGSGDDALAGGGGDDRLFGGAGDDRLAGGAGNDLLVGGAGADAFVFGPKSGKDVIRDFDVARDQVNLERSDLLEYEFEERGDGLAMVFENGDEALFRGLTAGDADDILIASLIV